ncbi:MAG: radical SAM protein [Deltaproteobacteria bacterium]|jgi:radical SAM protein with 4Fe4S-binding SPASM domain|nr:radical SAM protein [Deltaproteobacteria bacterium]
MLPVTDLIEVALGRSAVGDLSARAPRRFEAVTRDTPVVIWNVCMHCNMHCPHCYAAAVAEPSPTDLSHEEGIDLLDQLADAGVRVVIFSGGEPLLRADVFELIAHAKRRGISPQLSTNGVLIDEDVAKRLADAGIAYVGVSIDGIESFNDAYRGLNGGFDAALRGLDNAKAAGMNTGLRMTLSKRNFDQLEAMIDVARNARVNRFYVSHLVYSGRGYQVAHEDLNREQQRAALDWLFEKAEALLDPDSDFKIVTGSNDSDGVYLLHWIRARHGEAAGARVRELLRKRGGNSAGERILNIDSRGRVHPDQFWRAAVLGDIREQSFASILSHPLRDQLRRRLEYLTGRCGSCSERELCRGSHRERALALHRDPWASDPACVMEDGEIGIARSTGLEVAL